MHFGFGHFGVCKFGLFAAFDFGGTTELVKKYVFESQERQIPASAFTNYVASLLLRQLITTDLVVWTNTDFYLHFGGQKPKQVSQAKIKCQQSCIFSGGSREQSGPLPFSASQGHLHSCPPVPCLHLQSQHCSIFTHLCDSRLPFHL